MLRVLSVVCSILVFTACAPSPADTRRPQRPPGPQPDGPDDTGLVDTDDTDLPDDTDPEDTDDTDTQEESDPECPDLPDYYSPDPPTSSCTYMDWKLSPDGHYLVSTFGTSNDGTTWGNTTTCGWLDSLYDIYECRYDGNTGECLDDDYDIPWVQGHVDYDYDEVIGTVRAHAGGDVPWPEVFYVAGAQRFNCGTTLRVTNPDNGICVVVYAEDGGPGMTYEQADYGGRRILDSSPAVAEYLQLTRWGWASSTLLLVEWGLEATCPDSAAPRASRRRRCRARSGTARPTIPTTSGSSVASVYGISIRAMSNVICTSAVSPSELVSSTSSVR